MGRQTSDTSGSDDIFIMKLNSNGNAIWKKKIGAGGSENGRGMVIDGSGNIIISGYMDSVYGGYDFMIMKLNTVGAILWQKAFGYTKGEFGYTVDVDSSGNIYVCGYHDSYDMNSGHGSNDGGVIKLNTNGSLIWQKSYGGSSDDYLLGISIDSSDNIYVVGYQISDTYGGFDMCVLKLSTGGGIVWQRKIGGASNDYGYAITTDSSGNVYIAGTLRSDSYGGDDLGVIKLDSSGNLLWQKKIGGINTDNGKDISVNNSGDIYVIGSQSSDTYGEIDNYDYGIIRLDSDGELIWQKKIGAGGTDMGTSILSDNSGNVFVCGYQTSDSFGGSDIGVMKLNADQPSDMSLSIGNSSLIVGPSTFGNKDLQLSYTDTHLSSINLAFSTKDINIGDESGLNYIG